MNLSNCCGCGKLHLLREHVLCADCFKRHVEHRSMVRQFLSAHPGASVMDVARQTGLSVKQINELVKG